MFPTLQGVGADATDGFVLLGDAQPTPQAPEPPEPSSLLPEEPTDPCLDDGLEVPAHLLALDAFFTALEPVAPEQVALTLAGSACARLAGRAAYLGLFSAEVAARVALERDWQVLLSTGLSPEALAGLVRAEPWLPPSRRGVRFCDWLVARGGLDQEQLAPLYRRSIELGWPIFQVAMDEGLLGEAKYLRHLARFLGLPLARPLRRVPRSLLVSFPVGWVEHFALVPLRRARGSVVVAVAAPLPSELTRRLASDLGAPVVQQLAAPAAIAAWRKRWLRHWWRLHHASWGYGDMGSGIAL